MFCRYSRRGCDVIFFQAEDGIRDGRVTGVRRVLFRSLAAHQGARLVRLDGDDPAGWVALAEALTHADDGAPGADPADHGVRDHAAGQLSERLRAEPGTVLLHVPLRVELLRREIPRLAAELGDLGQRVI